MLIEVKWCQLKSVDENWRILMTNDDDWRQMTLDKNWCLRRISSIIVKNNFKIFNFSNSSNNIKYRLEISSNVKGSKNCHQWRVKSIDVNDDEKWRMTSVWRSSFCINNYQLISIVVIRRQYMYDISNTIHLLT